MPLFKDFSDSNSKILLWKYDENEELNIDELLEPESFDKISSYHPTKIKETLLVRKALKTLLKDHKILYKEREPFLVPDDYYISISHSFPFAAIAISKNKIGIDIEKFNPKILRIEHKFVYPNEAEFFDRSEDVKYLTIIWSLKESLYKIHHSNYWSLKRNYRVDQFNLSDQKDINCSVYDENNCDRFKGRVEFFEDYCFTIIN